MTEARLVKCQKCGKPLGSVAVLAKGLAQFQQQVQNIKIVAICIECYQDAKKQWNMNKQSIGALGTTNVFLPKKLDMLPKQLALKHRKP